MWGGNTPAFYAAQGMVEGSFDFDFADLPLEWQGDLIEWVNRTLRWREQFDADAIPGRFNVIEGQASA